MIKESQPDIIINGQVFIQGSPLPFHVLDNQYDNGAYPEQNLEIRQGGFGSDAAAHPTNPNQFYALTDRGPNADFVGSLGAGKRFLLPTYTPCIGLFELQESGDIIEVKQILLKNRQGQPITGLPNPKALGGTHEVPYDAQGNVMTVHPELPFDEVTNPINNDIDGLDPEGLTALADGSFWVSDEYGPHLVHYDADGVELARINPFSEDERNTVVVNGKPILLPTEFAHRRANRGMESLTITPDQTTLVGIMESAMDNPDKAGRSANMTRLITINLLTGKIGQYLYRLNTAKNVNSGIVALSNHEFYIIEHDRKMPLQESDVQKHIYKVDISQATDIQDNAVINKLNRTHYQFAKDKNFGLMINRQTLEQFIAEDSQHWEELAKINIAPVTKTLAVDVLAAVDYPHDKLEGLWLRHDGTLGLLNDDDFAITDFIREDGSNVVEQKYLDSGKTIEDANRLYIVTPNIVMPSV